MSVGSSWVICDSKSRPGFKYYFNTESGEAVWNLSNKDQIEKAKQHTQILQTKLGTVLEMPEPKDQPPMDARRDFKLPIINQTPNFCNIINTGTRLFNDNVWVKSPAVIQQPQIVLVPTPMLNTSIGNNNLHPTLAFQNASPFTYQNYEDCNVPNKDNFNSGNVPYNSSSKRKTFYLNNHFKRNAGRNSINSRRGSGDLRHKLARNRSLSESNVSPVLVSTQENFDSNSNSSENNSTINETTKKNQNKLTTNTFNLDDCYVVVDKDIILNEFVFFDNLVSNDPNFRLVVPHHVMSELKIHASKNGEARIRRIVRFLSQKIESRLVSLGEEIEDNLHQNGEKTIITCEKLLNENDNNVILVSNKSELKKVRGKNKKINIMSMCKFKDVLSKTKVRFSSPTRAIKIIISNNLEIKEAKTNENDSIREIRNVEKKTNNVESKTTDIVRKIVNVEGNVTNVDSKVANGETSLKSKTSPIPKQTIDTAVQTEMDTEVNKTHIFLGTNDEADTTLRNENTTNKREIRLNRTTPMQKARIEETSSNKKQYKWRKNRILRTHSNSSTRTQSTLHGSTETKTNIATKIIPNVTVTMSKQKDNSSEIYTENSSATPKTNSIKCIEHNRKEVKTLPHLSAENNSNIQKEIIKKMSSTESWIDSIPKSKSDTDKDSKGSSHKNVISTSAKKVNDVVHKVPVKLVNKNIVLKDIEMFTISGQSMEELLRIRMDEWVSRFVQIMEDILRDKLQESLPFENDEYPPPWNLQETARSIIKKYSNFYNVVDAANKLSFTLYKVSDEKGKIPLTLQPSQFMEMYSYGVYLIETLQDISHEWHKDDLHAAKQSLKSLLSDIENANMENSCSDIFGDDVQESMVAYTTSTDITESDFRPGQDQSTSKGKTQNGCATITKAKKKLEVELLYNLRSAKKTSELPEVSQSKSSNIDLKTTFFSNLRLATKSISASSTITSPTYSTLTVRSPMKSSVTSPVATKLIDKKRENDTSNNKHPNTNDEEIVSSGQPNFIRNFEICPEFEARLNKARNLLELDDCDESYSDDDQCHENAFDFKMSQYFKSISCVPKDVTLKDVPVRICDNSNKKELKKNLTQSFVNLKLRIIKETIADVTKHLSVTTSDPLKRKEVKIVAIKIFPRMNNIYNFLDTILKKEDADNNIKKIHKNVNADSAEKEMILLQRNTVTKLRDQAYIIIKNLKFTLSSS